MIRNLIYILFTGLVLVSCSKNNDNTTSQDDDPIDEEGADCEASNFLAVSDITFFSAFLSWDNSSNDVSGFTVEYGEAGFSKGSGTIVNNVIPFYNQQDLMASTNYEFYVTTICSDGETTFDSSRESFTTEACPIPSVGDVINITETSALVRWFGITDSYEVEYGEAGFSIGNGTVIASSTDDIELTNLSAGTTYDVYKRSNCNGVLSDNSEVVTFETLPLCYTPTDLRWTTITAFSISISWDTEGESSWQIQYGPVGFPLGSGVTANTTARPYEINGLSSETTYEFYVRANCGSDGFSEWSDSLVVTTLAP